LSATLGYVESVFCLIGVTKAVAAARSVVSDARLLDSEFPVAL
jgi:hypothetical protein